MTNDKDIIGIVKELCREDSEMTAEEYYNSICVNFPAITQALLIAVEALENIERKEAIECQFTKEGTALPPTPATDALKRIRSLPSA